jgi:AcrR family transcriptional regulator
VYEFAHPRYSSSVGGLRERKKRELRDTIADAAMGLFAERGFARVTVADVAAAADVSLKTVFNYFPTKEDLFFDQADSREAALIAALRDRPPGVSLAEAVERTVCDGCERMFTDGFAAFARIIADSPALQAKERELFARFSTRLADVVADESGLPPVQAWAVANALVGIHWGFFREVRRRVLAGERGPEAAERLREETVRGFELLARGLDGVGRVDAASASAAAPA